MRRLATWCFRHRLAVTGIWILLLVVLVGAGKTVGKDYTDGFSLSGTDSAQAQQLLAATSLRSGSGDDTIVFHALRPGDSVREASTRHEVQQALAAAARAPSVASIQNPFTTDHDAQISSDGRTAYAVVSFTQPDQNFTRAEITPLVTAVSAVRGPTLEVEFGGGAFQTLKGSPVSGSVAIGLAAAAIVLLIAFGSLLATLIPLVAAIVAVGAGVETVGLLSNRLSINSITPSVAALIGIGVAVDYALFVVTRHRKGLRAGLSPEQAAVTAVATSGRAVVFAGGTVATAMLGLLLLDVNFLTGVGLAAAITVLFAVAAAVTLLPALFGLLGVRVLSRRERRRHLPEGSDAAQTNGPWARWADVVQRHPAVLSVVAFAVMVVLAIPALSISLGSSDQGNDPSSSTTRKAYDLLANGFGPGFNGPLVVVGQTSDTASVAAFDALTSAIKHTDGVASVVSASTAGSDVRVLDVIPSTSPQSALTNDLISQLRDRLIPPAEHGTTLRAHVGGQTAVFQDFANTLSSKLPLFLAVVVLLGCLLLMIAFRSVVIPLTAAVMNVLAAGAAFGVIVAVFQWGWGSDAIGLGHPGPIESFLPVMLIAILFGLSMDYQVFLVSRIHEEWVRTEDTARAIRVGQAETGRVITAAAAIMVVVFLAFVLEGRRPIGEFGLGLAVAILLDALLLRTILVPATMQLMGIRNWWLPGWLDRLVPQVSIDSTNDHRPGAPPLASLMGDTAVASLNGTTDVV